METCYQLPPALAEVISPEKLGPINKHGIPWEEGREGSPARPALSPSPRWPINFSSEALGPGNLPVLSAHQATFSSLSCSLPVNQSPWEPGGMGGSSLEQQRAACLLTPRGLLGFARNPHNRSLGNSGGKSVLLVQGFQKALSQQAALREQASGKAADLGWADAHITDC